MSVVQPTSTVVHVNQHRIRANIHAERTAPPIAVRRPGGRASYTNAADVVVDGRVIGRFIYSPKKPLLHCGARLVFEAYAAEGVEVRPTRKVCV